MHTYIYIHMLLCMYINMCISKYIYIHVYICIQTYIFIHYTLEKHLAYPQCANTLYMLTTIKIQRFGCGG